MLFIHIKNKKYFNLTLGIFKSFVKITISTLITSYIFYKLLNLLSDSLNYNSQYKLPTIILIVITTVIVYILISIITKAFKTSDIKLKY